MTGGYDGYSMSNRARDAYRSGLVPSSKVPGIPGPLVRQWVRPCEWHHTSSRYNRTDFYDPVEVRAVFGIEPHPDYPVHPGAVQALSEYRGTNVRHGCTVTWLEWMGTLAYQRPVEHIRHDCIVTVKGVTAYVDFPDGGKLVKRLSTNGFRIDTPDTAE